MRRNIRSPQAASSTKSKKNVNETENMWQDFKKRANRIYLMSWSVDKEKRKFTKYCPVAFPGDSRQPHPPDSRQPHPPGSRQPHPSHSRQQHPPERKQQHPLDSRQPLPQSSLLDRRQHRQKRRSQSATRLSLLEACHSREGQRQHKWPGRERRGVTRRISTLTPLVWAGRGI